MKHFNLVIVALAVGFLSACGGDKKEAAYNPGQTEADVAESCTFEDGLTPAPAWICATVQRGLPIAQVASHPKTGAGFDFQLSLATAGARDEIARVLQVRVENAITRSITSAGLTDVTNITSISKQSADEFLRGSRVYKRAVNPKTGYLFVLVGMTQEDYDAARKAVIENALSASPQLAELAPQVSAELGAELSTE